MISNQLLEEFCLSNNLDLVQEHLYELMTAFMAYYETERETYLKQNQISLDDTDTQPVKEEYYAYLMALFIEFRQRLQLEQEKIMNEFQDKREQRLRVLKAILINYTRIYETERSNMKQTAQLEVAVQYRAVNPAVQVFKRWVAHANCCDICRALDGTTIPINEAFLSTGQQVDLEDGDVFIYTYMERQVAIAHPNDRCYVDIIIQI